MRNAGEGRSTAPFRIGWLSVAVLVTVAMFAWMAWHVFNTFEVGRTIKEQYVRTEELRDRVCQLHQDRMLSAAMLVASWSEARLQRHAAVQGALTAAIHTAMEEQPTGYSLEALTGVHRAHEALVALAAKALDLAREGRVQDALAVLSSEAYETERDAFSRSAALFIRDYREYLNDRLLTERDREIASLVLSFGIFAFSLAVWVVLVRRLERRRRALLQEVRERQHAQERLKVSQEEFRQLAGHLQTVREEERSAIAREVHDELGQTLTALKIDLSRLRSRILEPTAAVRGLLESIFASVGASISTVQRIMSELRPAILDDLGLSPAMDWLISEFQGRTGIRCTLSAGAEDIELNRDQNTALFRILQESLTNVSRHAEASQVQVTLAAQGGWLALTIADDGRGVSESATRSGFSYGLMGMRERAHLLGGRLEIRGVPGQGTTIRARIPLPGEPLQRAGEELTA